MKVYNENIELIIDAPLLKKDADDQIILEKSFKNAGISLEKITDKVAKLPPTDTFAKTTKTRAAIHKRYVKTSIKDSQANPWDVAHEALKALPEKSYVEPDINQEFVVAGKQNIKYKQFQKSGNTTASDVDFDPDYMPHSDLIWHLADDFSQLENARSVVAGLDFTVRIGHLDTGYNPTHKIVPLSAKENVLQRNFVAGEDPMNAHDPDLGGFLRMPNHGTGTIGILAGNNIPIQTANGTFSDYLGGAYFADIVCCRICPSVVLFKTSAFAEALNYLTQLTLNGTPVHVVSMSMGGAPTKSWADAVNAAYQAGITMVTAAGNNYNGFPTQHVVYPARFKRVISATGVTYDYLPYHSGKLGEMEGCYGPEKDMENAVSAFTPNTPWASGSDSLVKFSGAGTSSATPQIAAAAAIYYRKYHKELEALPEPWQKVEAIRNALFSSAAHSGSPQEGKSYINCFGNGILKAHDALEVPVKTVQSPTETAKVPWFPILNTLFKAIPNQEENIKMEMYNMELAQLVFQYPELRKIIDNDEKPYDEVSKYKMKKFRDAVIAHPASSIALKNFLMQTHM